MKQTGMVSQNPSVQQHKLQLEINYLERVESFVDLSKPEKEVFQLMSV